MVTHILFQTPNAKHGLSSTFYQGIKIVFEHHIFQPGEPYQPFSIMALNTDAHTPVGLLFITN